MSILHIKNDNGRRDLFWWYYRFQLMISVKGAFTINYNVSECSESLYMFKDSLKAWYGTPGLGVSWIAPACPKRSSYATLRYMFMSTWNLERFSSPTLDSFPCQRAHKKCLELHRCPKLPKLSMHACRPESQGLQVLCCQCRGQKHAMDSICDHKTVLSTSISMSEIYVRLRLCLFLMDTHTAFPWLPKRRRYCEEGSRSVAMFNADIGDTNLKSTLYVGVGLGSYKGIVGNRKKN